MKIQTLCLAKHELEKQGISDDKHGVLPFDLAAVDPNAFSYLSRSVVDTENLGTHYAEIALNNPQILAYIIVHSKNNGVLRYTRKHSPDETRLLGSKSIGFGGHSDLGDLETKRVTVNNETQLVFDPESTIKNSAIRELVEELGISDGIGDTGLMGQSRLKTHAFMISDPRPNKDPDSLDKIAVGQAHRAMIITLDLTGIEYIAQETKETQQLTWVSIEDAVAELEMFESWSQLILTDFITTGAVN